MSEDLDPFKDFDKQANRLFDKLNNAIPDDTETIIVLAAASRLFLDSCHQLFGDEFEVKAREAIEHSIRDFRVHIYGEVQ